MRPINNCRKWKIRKKVGYEAQQRFWISKGWKYRRWNLLVRFNRWCKVVGDKEIWAFEHWQRYSAGRAHAVYSMAVRYLIDIRSRVRW